MLGSRKWDRVFATASWFIVAALIFSSIIIWYFPPPDGGPVVSLLGTMGAQVFYSALYAVQAFLLGWSKVFKRKKMRKYVLMFIYLTGFFTGILTFVLIGWSASLIDNVGIAIGAAFCWLYWTFKTEYINPGDYDDVIWQLRDDTPTR